MDGCIIFQCRLVDCTIVTWGDKYRCPTTSHQGTCQVTWLCALGSGPTPVRGKSELRPDKESTSQYIHSSRRRWISPPILNSPGHSILSTRFHLYTRTTPVVMVPVPVTKWQQYGRVAVRVSVLSPHVNTTTLDDRGSCFCRRATMSRWSSSRRRQAQLWRLRNHYQF